MRPAAGLDNLFADEQFIEPGVTVGMDDAAEVLQMRLRMPAPRRPVLVLPVPGASTGVSSTCSVSLGRTSAARASTSGFSAAAVAPTQPDKVEVSRFTPSRAKISAWR